MARLVTPRQMGVMLTPAEVQDEGLDRVLASEARGCWGQRYGYLSDEKLAIMRESWYS
jgi:hypothetical protein